MTQHVLREPTIVLGEIPEPKFKSDLERDYFHALDAQWRRGDVLWFAYEPITLEIGIGARYKPDFLVLRPETGYSGGVPYRAARFGVDETKGFIREAGRVRLLAAMKLYPMFRWRLVKRAAGPMSFRLEDPAE